MKARLRLCLIILGLAISVASNVYAADYTFTTIDVPGGSYAYALGINDSDHIFGGYSEAAAVPWVPHYFLYADGSFTTIDFPGPRTSYANTFFTGMNNSDKIVGYLRESTEGKTYGFFYANGSYTTIDVPGATSTVPLGINDSDKIVGYYCNSPTQCHGFLYTGGSLTAIDVPGAIFTQALSINDSDKIVGYYSNSTGGHHGFLYANGSFTTIDVPDAILTSPHAINNSDHILGFYWDAENKEHVFLYVDGSFTTIDPIDDPINSSWVMNDSDKIVGYYYDAEENPHGFLYVDGSLTTIDFPGAIWTRALWMNNSDKIVGSYADGGGNHGFIASPVPDPVSIAIHPRHIKPGSKGKMRVAILSTKDFDAPSQVDRDSLTFGPTGDEKSLASCKSKLKDVDGDGLKDDLVCYFSVRKAGFDCGSTEGILKGKTLEGYPVEGSSPITIKQCK